MLLKGFEIQSHRRTAHYLWPFRYGGLTYDAMGQIDPSSPGIGLSMKGRHKITYLHSKYSPLWSGPSWFFITECTYASTKSKWSLAFYNIPFLWNFVAFYAASMVGTKKS